MMQDEQQELSASLEKLNQKLIRKGKELEILGGIFSQIRSAPNLDCILQSILEQLEHYFGYHYSMILLTGKGNTLKVVASHGYAVKSIGAKVEIGKGIIGTAAKRKQIIRVGNLRLHLKYMMGGEEVENTEDEIVIKLQGLQNPNSQVAIPLMVKDELIGVLSVEGEEVNVFKQEDEQIITLIANQAAVAINNAKMYEAEKARFLEIETINQKLSDLTTTQQQTLNLFVKYVPEAIVKKSLKEKPDNMFEGVQQDVAVLFCDIRDFTPLSEHLTPNQVVMVLNTFYARMNEVIKRYNGVINQFIGDEIFVIFGAPVPVVNCEEKAVRCAIDMIQQLNVINEELQANLGVSIKVGIGVNYGPVVTGNLGCEDKIAYSVTGDTVNTAKRIETLTREKPNSILLSDVLYNRTAHLIEAMAWEPVSLKGKGEKMVVYEVVGLRKSE